LLQMSDADDSFVSIGLDWQRCRFYFDKCSKTRRAKSLRVDAAHVFAERWRRQVHVVLQSKQAGDNLDDQERRVCAVFSSQTDAMRFVRQSALALPNERAVPDQWQTSIVQCMVARTGSVERQKQNTGDERRKKRKRDVPTYWCQRDLDRRFADHCCTENAHRYFYRRELANGRTVRVSPHYTLQYN